jgi:hypothetical protein
MDETPSMQEPEAAEEDVLELTEAYEAPTAESIGDLDVSVAEEPEPFPSAPASESVFAEPVPASSPNHPAAPASSYDPWSATAPRPAPPRPSPVSPPP